MAKDKMPRAATVLWTALLLCGPPTTVTAIEFMDCDSKYKLESVEISGCSSAPCYITLDTAVNVTTHFKPVSDTVSLTNNVYFSLNNARIAAQARPDPCSSLVCPLSKTPQRAYTYSSEVIVPANLPAIGGELAWSLQDDQSVPVICFRVDIQLLPISTIAAAALASQHHVASSDSPRAQFSPGRAPANPPTGQSNSSGCSDIPSEVQYNHSRGAMIASGSTSNLPTSTQHIPRNEQRSPPHHSMPSSSKTSRLTAFHMPLHGNVATYLKSLHNS